MINASTPPFNEHSYPYITPTHEITFPGPTNRPAFPSNAYLPLTIVLIILYSLIFIAVYLQLILILYYKHKRYSYQTILLFLCLIWSSLRIVLFSFYFNNAKDANTLAFIWYFSLYCMPVFLQFCWLCLLVSYYGHVYYKIATPNMQRKNSVILRFMIATSMCIFFFVNLSTAIYTREYCTFGPDSGTCNSYETIIIRVIVTDLLFVVFGLVLGAYLFKLARLSKLYSIPKHHNISILKAILVTIFTSFFLITRTLYNILAITNKYLPDFGFDWINVSDQADFVNLTETNKFITFSLVLLIWELIPTTVIIILFRLRRNKYTHSVISSYQSLNTNFEKSVFIETERKNSFTDSINSTFRKMYNSINQTYEVDDEENEYPDVI